MDLSERIRQLRKQRGLSQVKISELIGLSQAAYAKIETGDTKSISIEIGKGIAKALNISFNELFDIEATNQNKNQTESLISEIEGLKKQIEDLIKNSRKDEQIIDLHKQLHSHLKNKILETYFSAMTFISFDILKRYEKDEQKDLIFGILLGFTEEFKKELIENACYSISEFELFLDKRKQLFELEVLKKRAKGETKSS